MKADFTIQSDFLMGLISVVGLLVWYALCLPVAVTLAGLVIRNNWRTLGEYRRSRDAFLIDVSNRDRRESGQFLLSLFSMCAAYNALLAFGFVADYTSAYALLLAAVPLVLVVNATLFSIAEKAPENRSFLVSLEALAVISLTLVLTPFALQNPNLGVPEVMVPFAAYIGAAVIALLSVIPVLCLNRAYALSALTFLASGTALFTLLPLEPIWGLAVSCACALACHAVFNGWLYRRCLPAIDGRNRFAVLRKPEESAALQLAALSRDAILIGFLAMAFFVSGYALDNDHPLLPWDAIRDLPQGKTIPNIIIHYAAPVLALPLLVVSLLQTGRLAADARRIRRLKQEKAKLCRDLGVLAGEVVFNADQRIVSVSAALQRTIVSAGNLALALQIAAHAAGWQPWLNMFIVNRLLETGAVDREAAPFYLANVEHFLAPYARERGQPLSEGGRMKLVDALFFNARGAFPEYELDRPRMLALLHEIDPYRDFVCERYFEILGAFLENGSVPAGEGSARRPSVGKALALVKQGGLPQTMDECCALFANAAGRDVLEELYGLCGFHLGINLFLLRTDRTAPASSGYAGDFIAAGLSPFLTFPSGARPDKLRPFLLKGSRDACPFEVAPDKLVVFLKDVYRYRQWFSGTAIKLCARVMERTPESAFESALWNKGHTFESYFLFLRLAQGVPGLYERYFRGVRRESDIYAHETLANDAGSKLVDLIYEAKICVENELKEAPRYAEP